MKHTNKLNGQAKAGASAYPFPDGAPSRRLLGSGDAMKLYKVTLPRCEECGDHFHWGEGGICGNRILCLHCLRREWRKP